jgi:hypothetical protein
MAEEGKKVGLIGILAGLLTGLSFFVKRVVAAKRIVQYASDADAEAAYNIASAKGIQCILTNNMDDLSPYTEWILVGGPVPNHILADLISRGVFPDQYTSGVTGAGSWVIQKRLFDTRIVWAIYGWDKEDTASAAQHFVMKEEEYYNPPTTPTPSPPPTPPPTPPIEKKVEFLSVSVS